MKALITTVLLLNFLILSCESVRDSAGVNRKVIDEYSVVESPPLIIPPNFDLLPPNQIESKNINDTDSELAKEILFGLDENEEENGDESTLIDKIIKETKADEVEDDIRQIIDNNSKEDQSSHKETINKKEKKKRFFFF